MQTYQKRWFNICVEVVLRSRNSTRAVPPSCLLVLLIHSPTNRPWESALKGEVPGFDPWSGLSFSSHRAEVQELVVAYIKEKEMGLVATLDAIEELDERIHQTREGARCMLLEMSKI